MSPDLERQMEMDEMLGGFGGRKSPFKGKKKKKNVKHEEIKAENIKIDLDIGEKSRIKIF